MAGVFQHFFTPGIGARGRRWAPLSRSAWSPVAFRRSLASRLKITDALRRVD